MADSPEDNEQFSYHSPRPMEAREMAHAHMKFSIGEVEVETTVPVPAGKTTLRIMLPVLRGFTEAFVHAAIESAANAGETVSCRAHCGACCRQLVPITEPEAYQLAEVIAEMPDDRRAVVLARFEAAREKMVAAGYWERLLELRKESGEDAMRLGIAYFHEGIACPFLEEESCSIHPERPMVCREYLVANDPAHCARPTKDVIRKIEPVAKMSKAVGATNDDPPGSRGRFIGLVALVEWVKAHPEPAPVHTGKQLLEEVLTQLLRRKVGEDL